MGTDFEALLGMPLFSFNSQFNWNDREWRIRSIFQFRKMKFRISPTKIASTIAFLHGKAHPNPSLSSFEVWFVKIVCTLCFRYKSRYFDILKSDYFRGNLSNSIAFGVVQRLGNFYGSPELAYSFFRFTKLDLNLVYSVDTCSMLVRSFCQMGFQDLAKLVFECMRNDGHLPESSIFGVLVCSFARAGMFDDAKNVLCDAENSNVKIRAYVYNNLLNLLMKKNRVQEAVCFFRERILRSRCCCPDTCSFNIIIKGLCRIGEVDKAFGFLKDMESFGCLPDAWTYNTMISGFCRIGEVDRGFELLRKVHAGAEFSPDTVTYTSIISGYCKSGNMQMASSMFDEMTKSGIKPSLVTFNVLIDGFGKNDDMASALNMYQKMLLLGCLPDVVTFSSLIDGYCRTGQVDQGLRFWDEMNARNVSANLYTYCILTNALCKENRITEARQLLTHMRLREDIVPLPFVYNPVIDGFCKAGNVDEANVIVAEMEAKKCNPDKLTFTILIIGHCVKGRMVEAINIFNKMLALGCSPDEITVNNLISHLLKSGLPNEAFRIKQAVFEALNLNIPSSRRDVSMRTNVEIPVAA